MNRSEQNLLPIPTHVAIIMDGNGRWAQSKGLPRGEGHRYGLLALQKLIRSLPQIGVKYLTIYAFSAENWQRPLPEIRGLMSLLIAYLKQYSKELIDSKIRLNTIGRIEELPKVAVNEINKVKSKTAHFEDHQLTLALNYSSQNEVVDAIKRYESQKNIIPTLLNWPIFSQFLDTHFLPPLDLLIRTSGENRLSNFLLLQSAYTELAITPTLWPDFTPEHFSSLIHEYRTRQRRYGSV